VASAASSTGLGGGWWAEPVAKQVTARITTAAMNERSMRAFYGNFSESGLV
jgi:hypothetical protein